MNETGRRPKDEYSGPDAPEDLSPLAPLESVEKPELETTQPNEDTYPPKSLKHKAGERVIAGFLWMKRKASEVGLHDWLMVVFTGVLTWVAVQQFHFAKENARTSTEQVNKIIEAANRTEDAADSFSGSAKHIDDGIQNAVNQLQVQAGATQTLAKNSLEGSRPRLEVTAEISRFFWTGTQQFSMLDFKYKITVQNLGNLPATNVYPIYGESLVPTSKNGGWPSASMFAEQDRDCVAKMKTKARQNAITIYPTKSHTFEETGPSPFGHPQQEWMTEGNYRLHLYIRGCVAYESPTNAEPLHTGFFYILLHKDTTWGPLPFYKESVGQIYPSNLSAETKSN